jgi:hypothetical protein
MLGRKYLYRSFGAKLVDALSQVILDEVNILRENTGLPPRTNTQLADAILNKLENIPDYEWMKEL